MDGNSIKSNSYILMVIDLIPEAIPINEECVQFLHETISLRNWWNRELYRWKYLWKNHTFYFPVIDEDNKISLKLENRTIKGEELFVDNISEDELLNSLDQLISKYEQATDSEECEKIKKDNNIIYEQILFFKDYDRKSLLLKRNIIGELRTSR